MFWEWSPHSYYGLVTTQKQLRSKFRTLIVAQINIRALRGFQVEQYSSSVVLRSTPLLLLVAAEVTASSNPFSMKRPKQFL